MTRPELLKKLEPLFDEMEKNLSWGTIEIEYREGRPDMIRIGKNVKLNQTQENTRGSQTRRY